MDELVEITPEGEVVITNESIFDKFSERMAEEIKEEEDRMILDILLGLES